MTRLLASIVLCLGLAAWASAQDKEPTKPSTVATADFKVTLPKGWTGQALKTPNGPAVQATHQATGCNVLVSTTPAPAAEDVKGIATLKQRPGLVALSFIMPMAKNAMQKSEAAGGSVVDLIHFDTMQLAGKPAGAARITLLAIKEGQRVGSAVLHAGAIQSAQRLIFGVVVTRYVGPGPHDQVAFHQAILEGYGILRGVEPLE